MPKVKVAQSIGKAIVEGYKYGLAGGVPIGVLFKMGFPPIIAYPVGAAIGSALIKDSGARKIITINGAMDGVIASLVL